MLEELHVTDLALIDDVWLELGPGLTVLSGETGAGKTVLVGALKLLLGERADASLVRGGASEAVVEGRFIVEGRERTGRRRLSAEGRSRCYLDGEMSTVAGLAEAFGPVVDLHGQHDHQAILAPGTHSTYLDRFAGEAARAAVEAYRSAWAAHRTASMARDDLLRDMRDRERQIGDLSFQVSEIDSAAPLEGEDVAIEMRLPVLRHGERLAAAAAAALRLLRDDGRASDSAAAAGAAMHAVGGLDPVFDALAARVGEASSMLDDISTDVRRYADGVCYDPAALDAAEARLATLTALKRKYGPRLEDVIASGESASERLRELESGQDALRSAEARVADADAVLDAAARSLIAVREQAAPSFVAGLAEAARELAMPSAAFDVAMQERPRGEWTSDGPQHVEFLFSSNAGEAPRPLARIASGGEVSRVMLALKCVLGAADPVPVLVFDEVDTGIGGATAMAVGRRLAALAQRHQVLVVTHLAQVAAFADTHLVVEKEQSGGRAVTRVRIAEGDSRVAEIARMLSGTDSEAGLAHARELVASVATTAV